jgi:hypothetical protein
LALIIAHLLIATALFAGVYFLLPRDPLLRQAQGRLSLRPPLSRILWDSTGTAAWTVGALYVCGLLAFARMLPAALLVGLIALRGVWILARRWRSRTVVFDRPSDAITMGPGQVARASDAVMLTASGRDDPALELLLSQPGESLRWSIPWVDRAHARPVGQTIADYLGIPIMGVGQ